MGEPDKRTPIRLDCGSRSHGRDSNCSSRCSVASGPGIIAKVAVSSGTGAWSMTGSVRGWNRCTARPMCEAALVPGRPACRERDPSTGSASIPPPTAT